MWRMVWDTVDCRLQSDCSIDIQMFDCSIDIQMFCEALSDLSFFVCKGPYSPFTLGIRTVPEPF